MIPVDRATTLNVSTSGMFHRAPCILTALPNSVKGSECDKGTTLSSHSWCA